MAIRRPGARLLRSVPFAFVRARDGGRKAVDATIAMVPFIDFLVVLVVFLLTFFTASGEVCPGAGRAFAMPEAETMMQGLPGLLRRIDSSAVRAARSWLMPARASNTPGRTSSRCAGSR